MGDLKKKKWKVGQAASKKLEDHSHHSSNPV